MRDSVSTARLWLAGHSWSTVRQLSALCEISHNTDKSELGSASNLLIVKQYKMSEEILIHGMRSRLKSGNMTGG